MIRSERALDDVPGIAPDLQRAGRISGEEALFVLQDRGPGVETGEEERLFDKFYRDRKSVV